MKNKTKYLVENNKIIFENKSGHVLYYIRDNQGNLEGIKYNNEIYYYIKNISNDITGILNNNLEQIVFYEYDSYGNIISIKDTNGNEITDSNNIGIINPYRYKGYYYDTETNLYYLNTRYYSPVFGRFINADGYLSTGTSIIGNNMYAYCDNNPINNVDEDGIMAIGLGLFITGAILGITGQLISDFASAKLSSGLKYFGSAVGGGIGMLAPGGILTKSFFSGALSSILGNIGGNISKESDMSASEILTEGAISGTCSIIVPKIIPIKIPKITSGRNSSSAIYKTIITKYNNGIIEKMSFNTLTKIIVANTIDGIPSNIIMGLSSIESDTEESKGVINNPFDYPIVWNSAY